MRRLFRFPTRSARERRQDVDAELQFHLDMRIAALVGEGLDRDRARRQALREFGDVEEAREYINAMDRRTDRVKRRRDTMGDLVQDVRLALRRLRNSPGFTAAAIATLALGIGANTIIFSVVHAVLLEPLPFPEADQLYAVYSANRTGGQPRGGVSPVDLDDWRAQRRNVEDIGGYFYADGTTGVNLTGRGAPRRLTAVFVAPGFFSTLGVLPIEGRLPREKELVRGGSDDVVVLSHGFWQRELGGERSVVGSTLPLNGTLRRILGVLPSSFRFPAEMADVYVPYSTIPDTGIPRRRDVRVLQTVARARSGVSAEQVQAETNAIAVGLAGQYPENRVWNETTVVPLADLVSGPVRMPLVVLMGAVACVLLVACVNLAGLQLARAIGREREMSICTALGARRGRLVRQQLTESLVLAGAGCVVALGLAKGGLAALLAITGAELPRAAEVRLDGTIVLFAVLVAAASAVLSGLLPALRASSVGVQQALRAGGRTMAGATHHRLRSLLVVAEVALAMLLVAGAGLMARSFVTLVNVDAGFQPERLVAVQFTIDSAGAETGDRPWQLFYRDVIDRVRALPGVVSAAAVKDAPFRGNGERIGFRIPDRPVPAGESAPSATAIHVSDGYFRTIGARIIDGREFEPTDRATTPLVLVVNEAFGRRFFPGQRVVGQTVLAGGNNRVEIVGVVSDIRQLAMEEPAEPTVYINNMQNGRVKTTIVARAEGDPLALAGAIREAVWSLNPEQPITEVFTFDDAMGRVLTRPRLLAVLLGAFGVAGLLLGAIGIYGLLAFLQQDRRREIGVRLALGARPADIRRMFMIRGLVVTTVGIAIGLAGAIGLARVLATVLYETPPSDPATLSVVAVVLVAAAALASWLPAARAARVDPAETLRGE